MRLPASFRSTHTLACGLLACGLLACATTSAPLAGQRDEPATAQPNSNDPKATDDAPSASDPATLRVLESQATFADLVRLARSLGHGTAAASDAGCLLAREQTERDAHVLRADLMPALEGMPDPPTDLAARMREHGGAVALLTAWGAAGDARAELIFAGFTTFPAASASGPFMVLALSEDQAFIRYGDAPATQSAGVLTIPAAVAQVREQLERTHGTLFVTASASTKLAELRAALEPLRAVENVGLAVLLPAGTSLPAHAADASSSELCPTGLPDPGDADFGDLTREALAPALATLHDGIARCLGSLRSAAARVVVALRIDPLGRVQHACMLDAGGVDARTVGCLLLSARELQTPAPNPRGVVDLHLPLALVADGPHAQRALCD